MLSVLIPIYNFDVNQLVNDLHLQLEKEKIEYEIICIDDNSFPKYQLLNTPIENLCIYEKLNTNIGRSKIRNLLAQKAKHENLLFLDCDSKLVTNKFILNYVLCINSDIVYGGRTYENMAPVNKDYYLRWWYGIKRETKSLIDRKKHPYLSFLTNNFLIKKYIFNKIKMNENITGYGHEDTCFAQELNRNNYKITHIDNPVYHIGLESTDEFINKTLNGVNNLAKLYQLGVLSKEIKLIKYYEYISKVSLIRKTLMGLNNTKIINYVKNNPRNLIAFDILKLQHFTKAMN